MKKSKILFLLVCVLAVFSLASCAFDFGGSSDDEIGDQTSDNNSSNDLLNTFANAIISISVTNLLPHSIR